MLTRDEAAAVRWFDAQAAGLAPRLLSLANSLATSQEARLEDQPSTQLPARLDNQGTSQEGQPRARQLSLFAAYTAQQRAANPVFYLGNSQANPFHSSLAEYVATAHQHHLATEFDALEAIRAMQQLGVLPRLLL